LNQQILLKTKSLFKTNGDRQYKECKQKTSYIDGTPKKKPP